MDIRKITIAAMKAAETADEVSYVFNTFGFSTAKDKAELLQEVMGGKWFDVPKDDEARYELFLQAFLQGQWRYADRIEKLKALVSEM